MEPNHTVTALNDRVSLKPDATDDPKRAAAKQRIATAVTAIMTSLTKATTAGSGAPSSMIYLALQDGMPGGMGLVEYNGLLNMLKASDLVRVTAHAISLTAKGKTLADSLNEILAEAKTADQAVQS